MFADATDPQAFVTAVKLVLDNEKLRDDIIRSGRLLQKRYSLDAMVDAYENLIEQQIQGQS